MCIAHCNFELAINSMESAFVDAKVGELIATIHNRLQQLKGEPAYYQPPTWAQERERLKGSVLSEMIPEKVSPEHPVHFGTEYKEYLGDLEDSAVFNILGKIKETVEKVDTESSLRDTTSPSSFEASL